MKVYFISGLAADSRVFKHIGVPAGYEIVHLDWLTPLAGETVGAYAMRMAERIDTREPFALLGLSFGGMLATEIALKYPPAKTILLCSVPHYRHLPAYYRLAGITHLHKLLPVALLKKAAIMKRLFTTETPEDKEMLKQLIKDSDDHFIRWAVDAIVKWRGGDASFAHIHIHGTRDEVLPVRFTNPTHKIPGAGHLLVMNRAEEVNRIIAEYLLT